MRLANNTEKLAAVDVDGRSDLFAKVAKETSAQDRACGIVLAGGNTPTDLAVRQAQAHLRIDRLPSYWSHAALVLDWPDGKTSSKAWGVEVALEPAHPDQCVPERNGVTIFKLDQFADRTRWRNLAYFAITIPEQVDAALRTRLTELGDQLSRAALDPCRELDRYPLWQWIGAWRAFAHGAGPNPLEQNVPLPAAALIEYAFGSAGIDITPGATSPAVCPELLWSTALWWHDKMPTGSARLWRSTLDETGSHRETLGPLTGRVAQFRKFTPSGGKRGKKKPRSK